MAQQAEIDAPLVFKPSHNIAIALSAESDRDFEPIISFLARSSYAFALTSEPTIYESHHQQFWGSCRDVRRDGQHVLEASISGRNVQITEAKIRHSLRLDDEAGRVIPYSATDLDSTFKTIGYEGKVTTTVFKGKLSYPWKFFVHVFIHNLSNKTGGWNQAPTDLASAICAFIRG